MTNCPDLREHDAGYIQYDDDGNWIFETKGPNAGNSKLGPKRNEILKKKMEERKENWNSPDTRVLSKRATVIERISYDFKQRLKTDRVGEMLITGYTK